MSGVSKKSGGLTKNSLIKCTVDDLQLQQGLLVVSYAHKDNLFQGVLLQLNRERGIPCGISFPKDYCSGENKESEQNVNPLQVPPINQRHTYFQENDGRQFRSLRRVIKTPARFKNSRMSLRPVQRPILCAKCGALCEEKSQTPECVTSSGVSGTINGDHDKSKKTSTNGNQIPSTKKISPKSTTSRRKLTTTREKEEADFKSKAEKTLPISDESADYCYEGVGSFGIVENAWKRPLAKPLKYTTKLHSSSIKNDDGKTKLIINRSAIPLMNKRKLRRTNTVDKLYDNPNSSNNTSMTDGNTCQSISSDDTSSVFRITRPLVLKSTDKHKVNNLKLCISKLTLAQESKVLKNSPTHSKMELNENLWKLHSESEASNHSNLENSPLLPASTTSSIKMKIPIRRSKIRLRKRSSALPHRFRDKQSNKPTWRTRKISTMSNPEENLTCSSSKTTFSGDGGDDDHFLGSRDRVNSFHGKIHLPTNEVSNISKAPIIPLEGNEITPQSVASNKCEPGKTPVIKITFGSSGNGMVVQIPPRTTVGDFEESQVIESKAARKAMKKAKKEARKRHSSPASEISQISHTADNFDGVSQIALTPLTVHCNLSRVDHLLPTLITDAELTTTSRAMISPKDIDNFYNHNHTDKPGVSSCTADSTELIVSPRLNKRRKKEKKKKKTKDHKENNQSSEDDDDSMMSCSGGNSELSSPMMSKIIDRPPGLIVRRKESNSPLENPETPQRVCISLRRLTSNAYVPLHSSLSNNDLQSTSTSNNDIGTEIDEPHHFIDSVFITDESQEDNQSSLESIESYNDAGSNHKYKRGDIVWGKSTGCPWWPGKIVDILLKRKNDNDNDVRAKIAWYKSPTQSFITFTELHPFEEYFDTTYTKNRSRGCYQQAVREALIDAHEVNSIDFPND